MWDIKIFSRYLWGKARSLGKISGISGNIVRLFYVKFEARPNLGWTADLFAHTGMLESTEIKRCFRESGHFAGNRETGEYFLEI